MSSLNIKNNRLNSHHLNPLDGDVENPPKKKKDIIDMIANLVFACLFFEGFRTSIDHGVDIMFLKKTFKKISKPQMLAMCFFV